jgi:hypothetical protein
VGERERIENKKIRRTLCKRRKGCGTFGRPRLRIRWLVLTRMFHVRRPSYPDGGFCHRWKNFLEALSNFGPAVRLCSESGEIAIK